MEVEAYLASGVPDRIWGLVGMRKEMENRGMNDRSLYRTA